MTKLKIFQENKQQFFFVNNFNFQCFPEKPVPKILSLRDALKQPSIILYKNVGALSKYFFSLKAI